MILQQIRYGALLAALTLSSAALAQVGGGSTDPAARNQAPDQAPSAMTGSTAQPVGGGSTDPAARNQANEQRPTPGAHSNAQTVGGGSTDPAARNQKTTRPMEGRAAAEKSKMKMQGN
jgi:hypothetical protein